ncbi:MAG: DUF2304 domain-containing protein [Wenzhouxiangellaceae bacterium]|nr:DUF2304 domain-containing protein [Wenzhouxiangellaceae bacterium]
MITLPGFAALLALIVIGLILWLIRSDRLPISHALWWLGIAGVVGILGLKPRLIDDAARLVGVDYPPALLFTLAILVLVVKALHEDLEVSTTRRRLLRLAQKVAMLEAQLEKERTRRDADVTSNED